MRYAFISDIHSNRRALKSVLADIHANGVDRIVCLGDLVGYGPCPDEVIDMAADACEHILLGNHDAAAIGLIPSDCFNSDARRLIEWTAEHMSKRSAEFIRGLPLIIRGEGVFCSHAEFAHPARFDYLDSPKKASENFLCLEEDLAFVGHTHVPGVFILDDTPDAVPKWTVPNDFSMTRSLRHIVNVGTIGWPRERDSRSCYCLFDSEERRVYYRRIPYDMEAHRRDLDNAKAPSQSYRILCVSMSNQEYYPPPASFDTDVRLASPQNAYPRKAVPRIAKPAIAAILFAAASASAILLMEKSGKNQQATLETVETLFAPHPSGSIAPSSNAATNLQWDVNTTDTTAQKVSFVKRSSNPVGGCVMLISSDSPAPLRITAEIKSEFKLYSWAARFKAMRFQKDGELAFSIIDDFIPGVPRILDSKIVSDMKAFNNGAWTSVRLESDSELPPKTPRIVIEGRFVGEVMVESP